MDGKLRNMAGIYITKGDKILLLYRIGSRVVKPSWCNIGGHFEEFELNNARACALREVKEEIGLKESDLMNIRLKYITLSNRNGEIRQNYYFFADLVKKGFPVPNCDEGHLEWVDINKALERDMPYTSKEVLKHYLCVSKEDNKIYVGVVTENSMVITELHAF